MEQTELLPYGELVWDADVHPEGVLVQYLSRDDRISFSAGQFVTVENRFASDGYLTTAELKWDGEVAQNGYFTCVLGYFGWNDVSPGGDFDTLGLSNRGNRLHGSGTDFLSDFRILRLAGSWSVTLGGWRVTLADEWIRNFGADDERDAYAMGVSAEPSQGGTQCFYQWQTVDEDAVFTPVSQDDFLHGSGFRGHVFGCKRSLGETVSLRCWGLVSKDRRLVAANDRGRFRLDFDFKF